MWSCSLAPLSLHVVLFTSAIVTACGPVHLQWEAVESDFKMAVAEQASQYCSQNKAKCAAPLRRRYSVWNLHSAVTLTLKIMTKSVMNIPPSPPPHTHYMITLFVCHTKQYIWQFLTFTGRLNTSSSLTQKKSLSSLATPKWCRRASRLPSPCSSLTSPKNQGPCWMQLYYRRLLHRGRTTLSSTWEQRYWAFHSSTLPQAPHTQRI